jgi:putative nucleotidyltransferase with HDIG domain
MAPFRGLSWGGTAYVSATILIALIVSAFSWVVHPVTPDQIPKFLYLAVMTQVAALMPLRWRRGLQTLDSMPLVAAALAMPGAGVTTLALFCLFDGRRPSKELPLWRLLFTRAKCALEFGVPSLLLLSVPATGSPFDVPVKTLIYSLGPVLIGYPLTARGFAFLDRASFWEVLQSNVGAATIRSSLILGFGGGVLYLLLEQPAGYVMGLALIGLLYAVRANLSDAQRQAVERVQTLQLAAQALDARDPYTESHSERVSELAVRLAELLNLTSAQVEQLRTGALLHDLGKLGIRDEVLNKAGPLSAEEWAMMRRHTDIGADLIAQHSALAHLAPMVRHHHERWDGSGYPSGLRESNIPLGARIIAVADAFDTISGPRLYRPTAMDAVDAVSEISRWSNSRYDPAVVEALRKLHGLPIPEPPRVLDSIEPAKVVAGFELLRRRPRFALLLAGMAISSLGDPLTTVAVLVTIYATTRSPLLVGATYVVRALATILMSSALSSVTDLLPRRGLILALDGFRGMVLLATPFLLAWALWWLFPVLFVLAAAEAIAQPTREASLAELVEPSEIRAATAAVGAATNAATIFAYPIAGVILFFGTATPLFITDAVTFLIAGSLALGVGNVGGRVRGRRATGGVGEAWAVRPAREHLALAGAGAFFISMTLPTMILLAYQLASDKVQAQAYTALEAVLAIGIVAGHLTLVWLRQARTEWITALGLVVMGGLSIAVAASSSLFITATVLLIASVGNAFYTVGNRTRLQELSERTNRGSVMSVRFGIVQAMAIIGSAAGSYLAAMYGPRFTFLFLGVGLLALGLPLVRASAGFVAHRHERVDVRVSDRPMLTAVSGAIVPTPTAYHSDVEDSSDAARAASSLH